MIQLANFEEREFYIDLGEQITACDLTLVFQLTEETFLVRLIADKTNDRATKFSYTATNLPEGQYLASFAKVDGTKLVTVAAFVTGDPIFATSQYNTYNDDGTSTTFVPSDDQGLVPSVSQRLRVKTDDDATDVSYVRTINVTNGTLTDDGNGEVTLDTGGVETLEDLTDVDIINPVQGSVISYNSGSQEWRVNNGLQELLERFKASGTGAQIYDTLNDTTKGYIDILASSATMKVNHSGLTISEASPGLISFLVAAGTEGNEVEFEAMTIEGSDAVSTVADIIFKQGALTYWENATGKIWLRAPNAGNITVLLPSSGGTLALTTDIPSVPVDSVNGETGVVVLDTGDIDENGNLYYTEARVAANSAVAANTAKVGVIAGGTTGQALVKASGTDYDTEWADIAIDTQYHDRFQTDAETFRSGATETVELYYTAKADGDGLAESASSDTPTAGYDIRRKLYYSEEAFADPDTGTWVQFTAIADNTTFANAKAALLEYLKARTGGTVPISLKQTWEEIQQAPAFVGLLNETYGSGAEAAYSTRRLNGNVTDCMVIRRASDSTTQTIGFDGSGNIDEAAIETFCTGTTCTVYQWLDQSGNGNTATAGSGAEPTIYTGGAIVKENAKVAMRFALGDSFTTGVEVNLRAFFHVGKATAATRLRFIGSTTEWVRWWSATELRLQNQATMSLTGVNRLDYNLVFAANDTTSQLAINGGTATTATTLETDSIPLNISLNDSSGWQGTMQEMLIYESDKSTDRTSIEENVGDYYTQNTPLLDTYSGAAAAYSLRLLDSTYTGSAVEVYNGSSYADIGFNVFGELDTVALAAHCGSNDGFVSKWYDQSGNTNTAAQTTTANMPKIYDGSTGVVTENGKPAVENILSGAQGLNIPSFTINLSDFTCTLVSKFYSDSGLEGRPIMINGDAGANLDYRFKQFNIARNSFRIGTSTVNAYQNTVNYTSNNNLQLHTITPTNGYVDGTSAGTFGTAGEDLALNPTFNYLTSGDIGRDRGTHANTSEVIIWNSDKSTDRTGIESNIATFYDITI